MIIGCLTKAPCAQLSTAEQIPPGETLLDSARCAKASLMIVHKLAMLVAKLGTVITNWRNLR